MASACKACLATPEQQRTWGDHPDGHCNWMDILAALYREGLTIRQLVDGFTAPGELSTKDGQDIGWPADLGTPTYNVIRQRLIWAGVELRARGRSTKDC